MEVFVINLSERHDRKTHILRTFEPYLDFNVTLFDAIKHETGSQGLFKSFHKIIQTAKERTLEYIIICEDDHAFFDSFDIMKLYHDIDCAKAINCDILLGGPSNIHDAFFYKKNCLWISGFSGLQFTIVFRQFYEKILSYNLPLGADFDLELGKISNRIFAIYPMISYQKSFGYSDITAKNHDRTVEQYFIDCQEKMNKLFKVSKFYGIV